MKFLLLIGGMTYQFRQRRDMHPLETRIKEVNITVAKGSIMSGSAAGVTLR